jgi:hypothetical protein
MQWRHRPSKLSSKRAVAWLGAMVIAASGATVATATPAFAASDAQAACHWPPTTTLTSCGFAYFTSEVGDGTEQLAIRDEVADGYGVAVENYRYDLSNPGPYYGWNRDGADTVTYYTLHITEGALFKFRVCPEQDGFAFEDYCGPWAYGYA